MNVIKGRKKRKIFLNLDLTKLHESDIVNLDLIKLHKTFANI